MSRPLDRVLAAVGNYTGRGPRYRTKCPAHDGTRLDSLSITELEGGAVWLHPFCSCDKLAILKAFGLEWADLFPAGDAYRNGHKPARVSRQQREDEADAICRTLAVAQIVGLIVGPVPAPAE